MRRLYTVNVQAPAGFQNPVPRQGVQVQANQNTPGIDFQLQPAAVQPGSISGQVTDQAAQPQGIPNAQVTATNDQSGAQEQPVMTDAQGNYRIPNLAAGNYTVNVQAPAGFQNPVPRQGVQVQANQNTPGIDFQLQPAAVQPGSISGQVTDQAAQPQGLQNAQVTATEVNTGAISPLVLTDNQGNYQIVNLNASVYMINVQAPPGFQNPAPLANVQVQVGQNTPGINFQLFSTAAQTGSISGQVTNVDGNPIQPAIGIEAINQQNQVFGPIQTDVHGGYRILNLAPGKYTVQVSQDPRFPPSRNVEVIPRRDQGNIDFSLNRVSDFLGRLEDARFSIESTISIEEAREAVTLFSIVNLMLAGLSQRQVNGTPQTDVLGVSTLFYGLQSSRGEIGDMQELWQSLDLPTDVRSQIVTELRDLENELHTRREEIHSLEEHAKAQFNLGRRNEVRANVEFPSLFQRFVAIGRDPLLAIDIRMEESRAIDKTRIAEADTLLVELKGVIMSIVRSLSRYGTSATRSTTENWAYFESRVLEVLAKIAQYRQTEDLDEKNQWVVLADIIGKNRETEVAPHVVLARNGGKLLQSALMIYENEQDSLDDYDRDHLRDLFQERGTPFWTTRIRRESTVIARYPLQNWG